MKHSIQLIVDFDGKFKSAWCGFQPRSGNLLDNHLGLGIHYQRLTKIGLNLPNGGFVRTNSFIERGHNRYI